MAGWCRIRCGSEAARLSRRTKVYFDGGCRPNPGAMEIAVVTGGSTHIVRDLGHGTSMEAEWLALLHAARIVRERGLRDVVLLGDSVAVVDQANGRVRSRGGHLAAFQALAAPAAPPRVRHVKRTQNLAGIALAKAHDR